MAAGASGVLMIFLVMDAIALKNVKLPALFKEIPAHCSIILCTLCMYNVYCAHMATWCFAGELVKMEGLQSDSSQDQGALYALEDVQLADDFQPGARTVNGKERRKKRRLRNEPQSNIGAFHHFQNWLPIEIP